MVQVGSEWFSEDQSGSGRVRVVWGGSVVQ